MGQPHALRFGLAGLVSLLAATGIGCEAPPAGGGLPGGGGRSGAAAVAYAGGAPIPRDELHRALVEARGPEVFEELVLERLVLQRLAARGESLSEADLQAERRRLVAALDANENTGERLLDRLRVQRGLGEERFARLLRRNAGLRRLVDAEVEVTEVALRRAFERSHGRRLRVRLLTADTPGGAQSARAAILAGADFSEVAAETSTDASRDRGGLLPPMHPGDPTFPAALRNAASTLKPGELSGLVALGDASGFAVLRLEGVLPADGVTFEQAAPRLRAAVRSDLVRQRMEQTARTLRAEAEVVVLDPALRADR